MWTLSTLFAYYKMASEPSGVSESRGGRPGLRLMVCVDVKQQFEEEEDGLREPVWPGGDKVVSGSVVYTDFACLHLRTRQPFNQ